MNDPTSTIQSLKGDLRQKPSVLSKETYLAIYGCIYEDSPWIAEAAWSGTDLANLDSVKALHAALKLVVDQAPQARKMELIKAHPDLAVRADDEGRLSSASQSEQSGAGLDRCTPEELQEFQSLNAAYKEKFGFPYVLAIKGKTRQDILINFRERLNNESDAEFDTALEEIHKIALLRLRDLAV